MTEDLKKYVIKSAPKFNELGLEIVDPKSEHAEDNLRFLISYILCKRLGPQSVALQGIYVDMLRELHQSIQEVNKSRNVIGMTLFQIKQIFKKCMLIDEDELAKVINPQQGTIVLKNFVSSLGTFLGCLTLAK